ncbi:MAG: alpha/beta hydrolase [Candidatus Eremiobacteraeota bacterium]|nr:alpha/beta hydrolase [Candidatus Eremiobacteraeota bacterium]MBC5821018.1 alpha/beta hydrolase [Candidatus Eremiobacteraeota bacterium]
MTTIDASSAVADLHRLLWAAGISPPFVIVGYQNSAFDARLYADRYPGKVVGMVLVAPNVPNQPKRLSAIAPALAPYLAQVPSFDRHCTAAAVRGQMYPGTPAFSQCIYTPSDVTMPKALKRLVQRRHEQPSWWQDYSATYSGEAASSSEVMREQRTYDDMPLVVLTTTQDIDSLPIPKNQTASLLRAWIAWQREVAKLSHRGVDFVVKGSTEDIPIDRPATVVSAIDEVVKQARHGSSGDVPHVHG